MTMKKYIMMVENMNCEHCVETIKKALEYADVECEIDLKNKTVAVEGNGDIVTKAKRVVQEAGYTLL